MGSKRAANKRANREAFLAAARQIFATIGYEACTVRDIVRISGLASGSFYNYFVDKAAVFEAVVEDILGPLNAALTAARRTAADPHTFLNAPFAYVARVALDSPETAAIIAQNQTVFRRMFYLTAAKTDIQRDLEQDLSDWVARGRFVTHDVTRMAEAMISLGMDLLIQVSLDPGGADARVAFIVELFGRGLAVQPAKRTARARSVAKKSAAKKLVAKKSVAKKSAAKKSAAKKSAAKKSAAKKSKR